MCEWTVIRSVKVLTIKTAEGGDSLEFAFQSFQNSILNDPAYCMIDKDFTEISTIKKIFPNCIILLCIFHVLKYQKTLISTARCSSDVTRVDLREEGLNNGISKEAKERSDKFHKEIIGVEVRVGNGDTGYYTNLEDYFVKNWESCKEKWLLCERRSIPGLEDEHTNNRLERLWRSMKEHLKQLTSGSASINQLVDS